MTAPPPPRGSSHGVAAGPHLDTLGTRLTTNANALNFIRLLLALTVVLGHSVPAGGYPASVWQSLSGTAVNGFFAISGYLITGSRMRTSLHGYLWRRALRIYPAFWVSPAVTAAVIAPLSALVSGETSVHGSAVACVVANSTLYISQGDIPHLLATVPYPEVWNGSL